LKNGISSFHVCSSCTILFEIPVHEVVVLSRNFSFFRNHLGTVSGRVIGVSGTKKSSGVFTGREQHAIPTRIRRPICNAVLTCVHVYSGAQFTGDGFLCGSIDDFLDCEILSGRIISMQEGDDNPGFICDFD